MRQVDPSITLVASGAMPDEITCRRQARALRLVDPQACFSSEADCTEWHTTLNPSQPELTWTPSDPHRCHTMVFDTHCRMLDDPEGELRRILLS